MRIAVLLTCHNRRDQTLACLDRVFRQEQPEGYILEVFLVDDDSTDGSGGAVRRHFPQVHILKGSGNLFWTGGMRMAYEAAKTIDPDFYLWLNDDTMLNPTAIATLLETHQLLGEQGDSSAIIVGSVKDPDTGRFTYGGVVRCSRWHPMKCAPVEPGDRPKPCDTFNGNCVLIPRNVARVVGNLDKAFSHAVADTDYGLRSLRASCSNWIAPGFVGTCSRNPEEGTFLDLSLPLRQRWRTILHTKGLPPREWFVLTRRHAGWAWGLYWLSPYVRFFLRECGQQTKKIWT